MLLDDLISLVLGPITWFVAGDLVRGLTGKDRADAINDVRQTLLQTMGGLALVAGLAFTARGYYLSRASHETEIQGQITDRYSRAVEHLGSDSRDIRIGGIYELARIMRDSPIDRDSIVDVLSVFVREHAKFDDPPPFVGISTNGGPQAKIWRTDPVDDDGYERPTTQPPGPSADVQVALAVLGKLAPSPGKAPRFDRTDLSGASFEAAQLHGADFWGARLQDANFGMADLESARLTWTELQGATFYRATLTNADLSGARIREANFQEARLDGANFSAAGLQHASFQYATLSGTDFRGADMKDAYGITADELSRAVIDENTVLPRGIAPLKPRINSGDFEI